MLNYITYIVRARARKVTKFVAYLPCVRKEDNTIIALLKTCQFDYYFLIMVQS